MYECSRIVTHFESVDVGSYSCVFFFQAEDGIRDLVRSRGLGDVYKRQAPARRAGGQADGTRHLSSHRGAGVDRRGTLRQHPVSYTHLTLPTSDLV